MHYRKRFDFHLCFFLVICVTIYLLNMPIRCHFCRFATKVVRFFSTTSYNAFSSIFLIIIKYYRSRFPPTLPGQTIIHRRNNNIQMVFSRFVIFLQFCVTSTKKNLTKAALYKYSEHIIVEPAYKVNV